MRFRLSNGMKNAAKISSGTILGQIVSIVILPIITRIYGAEIMGIWTMIVSVSSMVNTVSDMGLSQTIMIEDESEELRTYAVILSLAVSMSLALSAVVWLYCMLVLQYSVKLTLIVVLFSCIYAVTLQINQISYTWLNKKKKYSALMKNPFINHCAMALCAIGLGIAGFKELGYFIGVTIGQLITLVHMRRFIPKKLPRVSFFDAKAVIMRHKVFVKYQMPTNVAIQAREQLPNLLIGALFGNKVLGYFSISQKLLNIPVTFIGQALGKVFYQKMAEMRQKSVDPASFIHRNIMRAMKLGVVPMVLFAAFGDAAIVMFFGREYDIGGAIVRIFVFRSLFTFISTCTQGMDIVLQKQKYSLITCALQTVLLLTSIILTYTCTQSLYICALAMTICFVVVQIGYFSAIYRAVGLNHMRYIRSVAILIASVLVLSILLRNVFIGVTQMTGWELLEYLAGFLVDVK